MADNPFDQFDAAASANPFDKFDSPVKTEEPRAAPAMPVAGDVGSAMPEAYMDPNAGIGASLVKAAKNVPSSAAQFGSDLVQPFIHPVDTATGIKNLGMGLLEKSGIVSGDEHKKYADAVGGYFADRYGGLENAKKTFENDPVGMAGDLSMLLSGGETALGRLPGAVGKAGEVAGTAARAIDPLRPVLAAGDKFLKGVGEGAAQVAGVTTGVGADPLKVATQAGLDGGSAGRSFLDSLTGRTPMEDVVNEARGAVAQMRQERGDAYRQEMSKTGKVGADTTILDFGKIDNAVMKAEEVQTYSGRYGTGPAQSLSPKTEAIRSEMVDEIEKWKNLDPAEFHTAEGIDALKKKLGNIRDDTQPNTPARVAADRIYNAVRQTIVDQVPEYAKVMKGYENATKQIKDIETTLSLKPNANVDTALRKLQSTLRDNVNTSFGRRKELAEFLVRAGAPNLMNKLAGQALSAWMPRGLARVATTETIPAIGGALAAGAPGAAAAAAAALPTMSPRIAGSAAYGIGAARRYAREVAPVLSVAPRASRQVGQIFRASNSNPYAP